MKKIIASLIVCGFAVAMVACGGKKEEAAVAADTTAVEHPAAATEHPADTTAAVAADTTAAK